MPSPVISLIRLDLLRAGRTLSAGAMIAAALAALAPYAGGSGYGLSCVAAILAFLAHGVLCHTPPSSFEALVAKGQG